LLSFVEDPHNSISDVAQQHIGLASTRKTLKKNKFYPYKIHLVQELSNDDFDRHIEFCNLIESSEILTFKTIVLFRIK